MLTKWLIGLPLMCSLCAAGCEDDGLDREPADDRVTQVSDRASDQGIGDLSDQANEVPVADTVNDHEVDLLQAVASRVVVSSVASAELSGPAQMLDGQEETAWNSESDDLAGAFVEVQLPTEVEVHAIRLIPGFLRNHQGQDLWEANHRITKLRVSRDGAELGEYELDPEDRGFQSLPVRGPGGLYRLEVVETTPGTQLSYREVCIAKLEVLGRVGAAVRGVAEAGVAPRR